MRLFTLAVVIGLLGSAVQARPKEVIDPAAGPVGGLASFELGVVRARGLAASSTATPDPRRLLQLRRMAITRAQRDLLATIKGLAIDSNTTVEETLDDDKYGDYINTRVEGTLRGAKILREGQVPGAPSVFEVVMEVSLGDMRRDLVAPRDPSQPAGAGNPVIIPTVNYSELGTGVPPATPEPTAPAPVATPAPDAEAAAKAKAEAALEEALYSDASQLPKPAAAPAEPPPLPADASYSGVIIDARGLGGDRAFWPRILGADGEVIFGKFDVESDFLLNEGAVAYAESLKDAAKSERAGDKPLVLKALGCSGEYKADIVLGKEGARTIQQAAAALKAFRVVFVL